MPLSIKPTQCPCCHKPVNKNTLDKQQYKTFISRQAFACPHCQHLIELPEQWEKLISLGLLMAVIIAPLSYYWRYLEQGALLVFAAGVLMIIIGAFKQSLQAVNKQQDISEE